MEVGLLTQEQRDMLVGQTYLPDSLFNPIQDADNNWIISPHEINECTNPKFEWIKNIPLIEHKPKINIM